MACICSAMGISTLNFCASPMAALVVCTPSATMPCMPAMISGSLRPFPSSTPTVRLRERPPVQVSTRSPIPARPAMVSRFAPQATASRGVGPKLQAITDSSGNGNYILQRAPQPHPNHITVGVDTKGGIAEFTLDEGGERGILGSGGDSRGVAASNFLRKGGAAQRGNGGGETSRVGNHVRDDLAHTQQSPFFDTFGGAHEDHATAELRRHLLEDTAGVMRGHNIDHDGGVLQGTAEVIGGVDRFRNLLSGKEEIVAAARGYGVAHFFLPRPQTKAALAFAAQYDGERRSPGTCADNCDVRH